MRMVRRRPLTHRVIQYSGGLGSWSTRRRVLELYGARGVHVLFADTYIEDEDLYRFMVETLAWDARRPLLKLVREIPKLARETMPQRKEILHAIAAGVMAANPSVHWISDGRDPWELFFDRRMIGNSQFDLCSETLKRNLLRKYMTKHFDPAHTVAYIGIDWTEEHRIERARARWTPWRVEAPLCEPPLISKDTMATDLDAEGIALPRLYEMGFAHNNCGGFCIKAGQASHKLLLEKMPDRFDFHAREEQRMREYLDRDVSILGDAKVDNVLKRLGYTKDDVTVVRIKGRKRWRVKATGELLPGKVALPLVELRARVLCGTDETDPTDHGGCACAL